MFGSIFLDFNLPNAATWFYFSLLLVAAIFFRFNRFWSLRNWDLCTLFLLVPGFLLLQEGHILLGNVQFLSDQNEALQLKTRGEWAVFYGYAWLIGGSAYFFLRCVSDLALVRRPALTPNLNPSGLGSLMVALFICLTAVAVNRMPDLPQQDEQVGKGPIAVTRMVDVSSSVINYQTGKPD